MAKFSVNAQRFDPYKNFKFRVKWDGRYVAGISKVGALKRTTTPVEHREVHVFVRRLVEVLQVRQRDGAEVAGRRRLHPDLPEPHPERVPAIVRTGESAPCHPLGDHPVGGREREACAPGDLGE